MRQKLSSRERVCRALSNREPDRVPINYFANAEIDRRLKRHFGLAADDQEGLHRALGVDFRGVNAPYIGPRLHPTVPGREVDPVWGIRTRWVEHPSGGYWDYCDFSLADADADTIANWPMPSPDHFDYAAVADQCRAAGDLGVFAGNAGVGDIINTSGFLFGMETTLIHLGIDDEAFLRFTDRRLGITLEVLRRTLEVAGGRVDFLWLGEDLGTQRGPIISLDLFRRHIRPRHQRFIDLARSFNLPVMLHSCGSSSWAYEDYIEMGLNAVDTLQPEAAAMAPADLKRRFGGRLAFHGGISTAGPVATGTVEETVENCCNVLDIMMPGGGYCFAPTHCLQDNSPTENVVAMYAAAREYGVYPK